MVKQILKELEKKMIASIDHFKRELSKVRTGRASASILEGIKVDYYGTPTPLNQVSTITVPDPNLITIQPWDPSILGVIEKAIRTADLGLNPINDGKIIKVPIPPLDEETRRKIVKHIGKMLEEEKTALRIMRRESKEKIEEAEENKEISEDDKYWGLEKLQELTDLYIKKAEDLAKAKEKEIMEF
ncbi:ribosome recycling factor [Candidatus Aminicenantes bacterium AC-335-A11]|jgi:ribosome recycling factor|nr:ribosome recycling factor [SCandidatus Aminicenantes bacterium Aminicenantia_JdfR_composite]MCP2618450.1 ribosome recycling factor [Candidatus Aminicenantes bacterium AC-335-A11]